MEKDDTFVSIKKSKLSEFFTHVNTTERFIQLTMEQEKEECLPCLVLLIKTSLHSPGPEQLNEVQTGSHAVCETGSHAELLPQMDDSKQKVETAQ